MKQINEFLEGLLKCIQLLGAIAVALIPVCNFLLSLDLLGWVEKNNVLTFIETNNASTFINRLILFLILEAIISFFMAFLAWKIMDFHEELFDSKDIAVLGFFIMWIPSVWTSIFNMKSLVLISLTGFKYWFWLLICICLASMIFVWHLFFIAIKHYDGQCDFGTFFAFSFFYATFFPVIFIIEFFLPT